MSEQHASREGEGRRTVYVCIADGEGSHDIRIVATEQEVFAFYEAQCGRDADDTLDSIKTAWANPDEWCNDGNHLGLTLYCATFDVWKVYEHEVAFPRSETPPITPTDNDGKEQDAFETWAKAEGMDMARHPIHWLFLNSKTNAARKGWRGALAYVAKVMNASPQRDRPK